VTALHEATNERNALSLRLEASCLGPSDGGGHTFASLEGTASAWPRDATNLLFRAFDLAAQRLGLATGARRFAVRSDIPIARGLGSSGAAVVAGLRLASELAPRRAELDELLRWGLEIEGHPDNTSAALVGGCTLAVPIGGGGLKVVQQEVHADLGFALAWPSQGLPTAAARAVLPAQVAFRRADPELLALGGEDRLHVPYRLPLIRGGAEALAAARASGAWLATISGSGSGLVAIGARARVDAIAAAMVAALRTFDAGAEGRSAVPDHPRAKP